jgi:hypothetical protein
MCRVETKSKEGNSFWLAGHIRNKIGLCRPVKVPQELIELTFWENCFLVIRFLKRSFLRGEVYL